LCLDYRSELFVFRLRRNVLYLDYSRNVLYLDYRLRLYIYRQVFKVAYFNT